MKRKVTHRLSIHRSTKTKKFFTRVTHANGRIICDGGGGDGYSRKASAVRAFRRMCNAIIDGTFLFEVD